MGVPRHGSFEFASKEDWAYAVNMVETVTWLAGRPDYLDELREAVQSLKLFDGPARARSGRLFEWLAAAMSYQGISDSVARNYMADHGRPRWASDCSRRQDRLMPAAEKLLAFSRMRLSENPLTPAPCRT